VNKAGTVELPDEAKLLRKLRGLERRRGSAGRDRVDDAPGRHDDRPNAVAGVVVGLAMERTDETITALKVPRDECDDDDQDCSAVKNRARSPPRNPCGGVA